VVSPFCVELRATTLDWADRYVEISSGGVGIGGTGVKIESAPTTRGRGAIVGIELAPAFLAIVVRFSHASSSSTSRSPSILCNIGHAEEEDSFSSNPAVALRSTTLTIQPLNFMPIPVALCSANIVVNQVPQQRWFKRSAAASPERANAARTKVCLSISQRGMDSGDVCWTKPLTQQKKPLPLKL